MNKLDGIDAGRCRVTFEGEYKEGGWFSPDGTCEEWRITDAEAREETFQITRIVPVFKAGDEVVQFGFDQKNTVVAILNDGRLVVEYQTGDSTNVVARDPSCFTHA